MVPLKFHRDKFSYLDKEFIYQARAKKNWQLGNTESTDYLPQMNYFFNTKNQDRIGCYYKLSETSNYNYSILYLFRADNSGRIHESPIEFKRFGLYVFYTGVAFLCIEIHYNQIEDMAAIINPGQLGSSVKLSYHQKETDFNAIILDLMENTIIQPYFDVSTTLDISSKEALEPILANACIINIAEINGLLTDAKMCKDYAYNLRRMNVLDSSNNKDCIDDDSYIFPKLSQTIEWCISIYDQVIAIVHDSSSDLDSYMDDEFKNRLMLTVLALYQKYSCLDFYNELYAIRVKEDAKENYSSLYDRIIDFITVGSISTEEISNWASDKLYFDRLMDSFGIRN